MGYFSQQMIDNEPSEQELQQQSDSSFGEYMNELQHAAEQLNLNELKTLGAKNEHHDNDFGSVRNRKDNEPAQHESSRNITNSSDTEATPF